MAPYPGTLLHVGNLMETHGGSGSAHVSALDGKAVATEEENYPHGSCGAHVDWMLKEGTLTFSGTGAVDASNRNDAWLKDEYKNSIERVVVEKGVTSIGDSAFYWCSNLTSVTLPEGLTSIGKYAFFNCTALTNVTLPNSVTSLGDNVFNSCSNLENMDIPDGVTEIPTAAFEDCKNLKNVTIPNGVTTIGTSAFVNCTSLPSVSIPDSVTIIYMQAFNNCDALTFVRIPGSVTLIGTSAFGSCNQLKTVVIDNGMETIMQNTFSGCPELETVFIPKSVATIHYDAIVNNNKVTIFGYAGSAAQTYAKGNEIPFTILDGDTEYTIDSQPDGKDYVLENDGGITVTCSGDKDKLRDLYMDGRLVNPTNYVVKKGSTILALKPKYVETLSAGEHTLVLLYTDGYADATIQVAGQSGYRFR